jgi:L-lactate dehydrogenase (cytochrome)
MFHYIDGGAEDEWSLDRNTDAFNDYQLLPSQLQNVEHISLKTEVCGHTLDIPIVLAPTGMSRLFHHDKEVAVAKASAKSGALYTLSTMATTSLEEIAGCTAGPKMFQIYILRDRELNRERDLVTGMKMPPRFTLASLWSFATHPYWAMNLALHPDFKLANVVHRVDALGKGAMGLIEYVSSQFDRRVTWDDAAWLAEQWDGPFVIKGLQSPADARRAAEIGASAIMISNHGGRQLEGTPAPIDCVAPIRDEVGSDIELIVDGGIRRGTQVIKALALGADACSIGRPYLYGLAAGGQEGVEHTLGILRSEIERSMALMG